MKLFLNVLLLATIKIVSSNNSHNVTIDISTSLKSNQISNNWILKFDTTLNHLVVDRNTGQVFIGGVNCLYQLSPDLEIQALTITGPRNDSTNCRALVCIKNDTIYTSIDNYNKLLLIDYETNRLITCGSMFQGVCTVRNLQNASIVEQEIEKAVVSNNNISSTVAFIAPGPPPFTTVMYVGVTYAGKSPYQREIPAVSSRSLENGKMFQIVSSSVMFINSYSRESHIVNYIYGFSSEGFSYFLTTQLKHGFQSDHKEYITKLVRICQDDSNYLSYTEIPVDCLSDLQDGIKYNLARAAYLGKSGADLAENLGITLQEDVLYVVFSEGNENVLTNRSALCVYSLKSIRRKFMQNIQACFDGNGYRGLDFILPNISCVKTKITISEDFCGLDVNSPLGGEQPIAAAPIICIPHQLTSVAATRTSGYTVVFIGTIEGHLKKVLVESATSAIEYADIVIDEGSKVNADMHFDAQELNLYVMTERQVAKVKVHDCTTLQSCSNCLGATDPYCGWCSFENKCTLRSNCQHDNNDPLSWVSHKSGKCSTIMPNELQKTYVLANLAQTLELHIEHLPAIKEQLICAFSTADKPTIYTNTASERNVFNCQTPTTDELREFAQGKHYFTMKLSLRTVNGPDLVSTDFTFFNCSTYLSCTLCVSSGFPCDWCAETHHCSHQAAQNCSNGSLVTGVSRIGPSNSSGPEYCPALSPDDSSVILVASGVKKSITVKVRNVAQFLGQIIGQAPFICQFKYERRVRRVKAFLLVDTIYCDPMEFKYASKSSNLTTKFAVLWGGSNPLDNPDNIHVVIYRCHDMGDSCSTCLTLPEMYNCGWCQSTSTCDVDDQCTTQDEKKSNWLNHQQICPNPKILSFKPITGPWEGGTNITIRGIDLGKNLTDIYSGVKAAGISCMPYLDLYVDSKEIVCTVSSLAVAQYQQGKIVVQIADYRAESTFDYEFVNPQIDDFHPKVGPISGGTQVTIIGKHLNAGSRIKAFIGEQQCELLSADETQALCRTVPANGLNKGKLKMTFDNGVRECNGDPYEYVKDPTIEYVSSGPTGQWNSPKGIRAGGIKITVVGNQFASIQQPNMYVYYEAKTYLSECKVVSNTEMYCYSPRIDYDNLNQSKNVNADSPVYLEYGFQMDDVVTVRNLSNEDNRHRFELYVNPVYLPFEENIKYLQNETLTIHGRDLDRACGESDIVVMIGNDVCTITSLSRQKLTCGLSVAATYSTEAQTVSVKVGNVLNYEIGTLVYTMYGLSRLALFGVIAGVVFFLLTFVVLLTSYRTIDIHALQVAVDEAFDEL